VYPDRKNARNPFQAILPQVANFPARKHIFPHAMILDGKKEVYIKELNPVK